MFSFLHSQRTITVVPMLEKNLICRYVVNELIDTEQSYIQDLGYVVKVRSNTLTALQLVSLPVLSCPISFPSICILFYLSHPFPSHPVLSNPILFSLSLSYPIFSFPTFSSLVIHPFLSFPFFSHPCSVPSFPFPFLSLSFLSYYVLSSLFPFFSFS